MRKLKTTSEPLETTESALEMQQGNTIILNPALHSAAANLTENKKQKGSKKPPALVLSNVAPGQNPPIYSASSPGTVENHAYLDRKGELGPMGSTLIRD